jgi:hypothetical protein
LAPELTLAKWQMVKICDDGTAAPAVSHQRTKVSCTGQDLDSASTTLQETNAVELSQPFGSANQSSSY